MESQRTGFFLPFLHEFSGDSTHIVGDLGLVPFYA